MRYSAISSTAIFAAAASVLAVPVADGDINPITVKCHNNDEYTNYLNCFNEDAVAYCTDFTGSSSGHAYDVCLQQWQKHCAELAGCDVSN